MVTEPTPEMRQMWQRAMSEPELIHDTDGTWLAIDHETSMYGVDETPEGAVADLDVSNREYLRFLRTERLGSEHLREHLRILEARYE